jgi:hypothetical protein
VFHAGNGNLNPPILYDANKPGELEKTEEFGAEIPAMFSEASSSGSNAPSTTRAFSIPARCFRPCTAAPNWVAYIPRFYRAPASRNCSGSRSWITPAKYSPTIRFWPRP